MGGQQAQFCIKVEAPSIGQAGGKTAIYGPYGPDEIAGAMRRVKERFKSREANIKRYRMRHA